MPFSVVVVGFNFLESRCIKITHFLLSHPFFTPSLIS
jgi:hypothetical protein